MVFVGLLVGFIHPDSLRGHVFNIDERKYRVLSGVGLRPFFLEFQLKSLHFLLKAHLHFNLAAMLLRYVPHTSIDPCLHLEIRMPHQLQLPVLAVVSHGLDEFKERQDLALLILLQLYLLALSFAVDVLCPSVEIRRDRAHTCRLKPHPFQTSLSLILDHNGLPACCPVALKGFWLNRILIWTEISVALRQLGRAENLKTAEIKLWAFASEFGELVLELIFGGSLGMEVFIIRTLLVSVLGQVAANSLQFLNLH